MILDDRCSRTPPTAPKTQFTAAHPGLTHLEICFLKLARILLLYIFETYRELSESEWRAFTDSLTPDIQEEAMTIFEQAQQKGRIEGEQKGQAKMLINMLALKFGPLSNAQQERIRQNSMPELNQLMAMALKATSLDELFNNKKAN